MLFKTTATGWAAIAATASFGSLPAGTAAAPAVRPETRTAARVVAVDVAPPSARLLGPRSEQGLVVTGRYSDGSERDLTASARYRVSNSRVVTMQQAAGRRVVRPVSDGAVLVTVSLPGGPAAVVKIEVAQTGRPAPVSFRNEVIPVLTRLGCSAGVCHGTPTGKGGFRLSLQGFAPETDYDAIVRDGGGRRANKADPGRSLILLKPMAQVPHGGGKRLSAELPEFSVLSRWIGEGLRDDPPSTPHLAQVEILPGRRTLTLPNAKQQVEVQATFSDGSSRDVTSLAKLSSSDEEVASVSIEGLVDGRKQGDVAIIARYQDALVTLPLTFLQRVPGFAWNGEPPANYVDSLVYERLKLFEIPVSGPCSDSEFARRAYLDSLGVLPTPDEVRRFLAACEAERRARGSVEARKERSAPATPAHPHSPTSTPDPPHLSSSRARANLVERLLQRPEFADFWALKWADLLRVQDETMTDPGARAFHGWIRQSLAANQPLDQFAREILTASGPTLQRPAANFYRTATEPYELSQAAAQLFLGVRLQCARCHNHPYDRWTQDEYYELAACFAGVRRREGPAKDEETVDFDSGGQVTNPRTGNVMRPKLLGAGFVQIPAGQDPRPALAKWATSKENPFFARVMVNRIWANLLGRGIVEPIDDFRPSNPAANEPLLAALARDFAAHGFDLRALVRTIMTSHTYQASARSLPRNREDHALFSHAGSRLLTAEQLADAISRVTGVPDEFAGYPHGTRAAQIAGTGGRTPFMKLFGRPDRNLNCECERETQPTLFEALALISGRSLDLKLRADQGTIATLAASQKSDAAVVEELYLSALARLPGAKERERWQSYFHESGDRRKALEDLGWVLINSKEFLFRY